MSVDQGTLQAALAQHTRGLLEDNWAVAAVASSGADSFTVRLANRAATVPNVGSSRITLLTGATVTFVSGAAVGFSSTITGVTSTGSPLVTTVTMKENLPDALAVGDLLSIYLEGASAAGASNATISGSTIQLPTDLQGVYQPSADSTTATLDASAVYTGTAFDTTNARGIIGSIFSDQSGTLQVEQSPDGTNWDVVDTIYYPGGSLGLEFPVPVVTPGKSQGRLVYTNGATTQTAMRLEAWTTPQPVERSASVATETAGTTSITTGGTSQALFGARQGRRLLLIQNPSTATGQGITTAESLWLGIGVAATTAAPSIELVTGALVIFDVAVDPQAINVIAATTGHAFSARQG